MSKGTILGFSALAVFFIGGPIVTVLGSHNPTIGIGCGVITFIILSALFEKRS